MLYTAIFVVLVTGCRPKEAAYIVHSKSIRANDYYVKHMVHKLQAFVPASVSKTKRDYLWLLPDEFEKVYNLILNLKETGFATYAELRKPMVPFYTEHVLKKAKVPVRHSDKNNYCMRTSRAYRATEWIKLVTEYRFMKWKPEPLNPAQHE